jgi:hypothetical protein
MHFEEPSGDERNSLGGLEMTTNLVYPGCHAEGSGIRKNLPLNA